MTNDAETPDETNITQESSVADNYNEEDGKHLEKIEVPDMEEVGVGNQMEVKDEAEIKKQEDSTVHPQDNHDKDEETLMTVDLTGEDQTQPSEESVEKEVGKEEKPISQESEEEELGKEESVVEGANEEGTNYEETENADNSITLDDQTEERKGGQISNEVGAKEAEEKRLAEEQERLAEEAEKIADAAAAKEAEEKKLAEEQERLAEEERQKAKKIADEAAAKEAEEKRFAEEQERLAEEKRLSDEAASEEAEERRLREERRLAAKELLEKEARLAKQTRLAEEELINKEKECGTLHVSQKVIESDIIKSSGSTAFEEIALYSEKVKGKTEVHKEDRPDQIQQKGLSSSNQVRPIVICGPSGVGKGTLIDLLMKRFPDDQFGFSVSHTTRKPREKEIDGLHYHFTNLKAMKDDIDNNNFIEFAEVHGNYYGTSFESVRSVQSKGQVCILDIDIQGARNVKRSNLNAHFLFIAPPSMEDLESRLRGRKTESEDDIKKRLANAAAEIEYGKEAGNFEKIVTNSDLDTAAAEIYIIVKEWYPSLIEAGSSLDKRLMRHCQMCVIS